MAKTYYIVGTPGGVVPKHVDDFYKLGEKSPDLASWDAWLPAADGQSIVVRTSHDLSGPGVKQVEESGAQAEIDKRGTEFIPDGKLKWR